MPQKARCVHLLAQADVSGFLDSRECGGFFLAPLWLTVRNKTITKKRTFNGQEQLLQPQLHSI